MKRNAGPDTAVMQILTPPLCTAAADSSPAVGNFIKSNKFDF